MRGAGPAPPRPPPGPGSPLPGWRRWVGRTHGRRRDGDIAAAPAAAARVLRAAPAAARRRRVHPLSGQRLHLHASRRPQGVFLSAHAQRGLAGARVPGRPGHGRAAGPQGACPQGRPQGSRVVPHSTVTASLLVLGRGRCWAVQLPVPFSPGSASSSGTERLCSRVLVPVCPGVPHPSPASAAGATSRPSARGALCWGKQGELRVLHGATAGWSRLPSPVRCRSWSSPCCPHILLWAGCAPCLQQASCSTYSKLYFWEVKEYCYSLFIILLTDYSLHFTRSRRHPLKRQTFRQPTAVIFCCSSKQNCC